MRLLVLNASPRRRGTIDSMVDVAVRAAGDHDVTRFDVNRLAVRPCIACMQCRSTGVCALPPDDGHVVGEAIDACEALIVATPVYWANMNGQLKVLFDRLVYKLMGENRHNYPVPKQKGKPALVLTACTTNRIGDLFAGESRGAQRALKEILSYSGFTIVGMATMNNTRTQRTLTPGVVRSIQRAVAGWR